MNPSNQQQHTPDSARLEAALEDRLQQRSAPDLTGSILAAAGMESTATDPRPSRWRGWLVAALVIFAVSIIPTVQWLQGLGQGAVSAGNSEPEPQDPAPDATETQGEKIVPADREAFLAAMQDLEGISAAAQNVHGLPAHVPGEAPLAFTKFWGPDARRDLGWSTDLKLNEGFLTAFVDGMSALQVDRSPPDLGTHLHVRFHLSSDRFVEARVYIPTEPDIIQRYGVAMSPGTADGTLLVALEGPFVDGIRLLGDMAVRTAQSDSGIFSGEELDPAPGVAKRATHLRLHDTTLAQLTAIGGSTACETLDVRFSPELHGGDFIRALQLFPNLKTLIMPRGLPRGPFAGAALPQLEQLIVCASDEDPFGPHNELNDGPYRGETVSMETRAVAPGIDSSPYYLRGADNTPLLQGFPNLETLIIPGAGLTDADFAALPRTLQRMVLRFPRKDGGRNFTDKGIASLTELPVLKHLDLSFARSNLTGLRPGSDMGMGYLAGLSGLANVQTLVLDGWFDRAGQPTGAEQDDAAQRRGALTKIATLPQLRHLSLRQNPDLTASDLDAFRSAPNLRLLDLRGCSALGRNALLQLAADLPQCELRPAPHGPFLSMREIANPDYQSKGVSFDLAQERDRLEAWLDAQDNRVRVGNDPAVLDEFHALAAEQGGPLAGENLRWCNYLLPPQALNLVAIEVAGMDPVTVQFEPEPDSGARRTYQLVPINMHDRGFTQFDFVAANAVPDSRTGHQNLQYQLSAACSEAYGELSQRLIGKQLPILLDHEIISAPKFMSAIRHGVGQVSGLDTEQVEHLVRAVNGG